MSIDHQSIVDVEATQAESVSLKNALIEWLQQEGIIASERSDCVLGNKFGGFRPGLAYAKATGPAEDSFLTLRTNGVELIAERRVFDAGELGVGLVCTACSAAFDYAIDGWGHAINEWHTQTGNGELACPTCGASRPITQWLHDPAYGFGNLGLKFWNWPPLSQKFIEEVAGRLRHNVVLVSGRL